MSKLIPRKIKKACKNITLVYNNDEACSFKGCVPRYRRNTKWIRKVVCLVVKEQRELRESLEKDAFELFEEKIKDYDNRHKK
ncbi:hypothetical protein [Prevotella sp. KH2C16]|uniref:hypothetical protein n=1 Tax=Prevotella sp. KH2C16 TaxID=1855325 RepID=UPI0008EF8694|nr:hypothetical protein [Prevotella sp. KH2C16]SFG56100.1 hypothetical protein SAMN05216383_12046 [Prevotella sp. KH2C16]